MTTTIHKNHVSYNYDIGAHNIIPTGDINLFLENGWEWFDFVGVKYKDNDYVPYKTRAVFTKSDTAALFIIENKSSIENRFIDHIKQRALREAKSFNKPATYSNKYKKYVPPCPAGEEYLNHQIEAARWMLNRNKLLLADKPGLGKTISAYCTINAINDVEKKKSKVLIVSPAKLQKIWIEEGHKWAIDYSKNEIEMLKSGCSINPETNIMITSYETLDTNMPALMAFGADILISDESHLVKNEDANRTQNLVWLLKDAKFQLLMTGTPILNRHKELYTLVQMLKPDFLPHYHCFPFYQRELKKILFDHIMLMRDTDVLENKIPKHSIIVHPVTISLQPEYAGFKKPESVLRHEVGVSKVNKAVDLAKKLLQKNEKIVIYCYHTDVADKINEQLSPKYEVVVSHGKKSVKQAKAAEDSFRKGTTRVFIGTIKACGTGLTLIEANHMIIAELDWTPSSLEQTEKRINRIGQTIETTAHYLIAKGISVEENMLKTLDVKRKIISIFK